MDLQASTNNSIKQGLPSAIYSLPNNGIPGQHSQHNEFSRQIPSRVSNTLQQPCNQQQLGLHYENGDLNENQITQNLQINQGSAAIGSYDARPTRTEQDQGQEQRRNSAPLEACKNEISSRTDLAGASGAMQNKQGICSDPSSRFFILEQFVEPIYQDFVYLTENVLNKNMKSANKQLQDTLMNYFLENHVSNLIIKDMNCISKRAVRCEIEKSMIKTKTAKYMNLLNAFEGKVKLFAKEKHYENLLMNLITDENSGAKDSEQWKTLVRKRILALLLYVHWQTLNADQIFNDFFAIWDRIYPNHPLPQKAKKAAGTLRGQESLSRAYSEQLNPIGQQRLQQPYDTTGMNKQMKRNRQKTIETMNLSQSSLSSQITYGYLNSNTSNHTPSTSSLFQPYQQMLSQQQPQIPPKNQGGVNGSQQGYTQQQYVASCQQRLFPQTEQSQKMQQQINSNQQAQEGTGLAPLQGGSTFAYYPNQNNYYQPAQPQQQWAQSRQQMELPLDDLTNFYQSQTQNEAGIYQQSNQNQQIPQSLPVQNARPAKQMLKGRMRSQSWDDQGYKKEEDRYLDKQFLPNNNNNNNYSSQSVASDLAQINSDALLLGQFGSMQQQQQHQPAQSYQFYSQNAYDIPSMEHVDGLFEPQQYAQTQQSYYVDYSRGMNQQPSNTNQFLDLQQQRQQYPQQIQQQQQQQQSSGNNSQFVSQNSYFQTANPYLNSNYNNVQYQSLQQQQQQLQQPQLQQQQYQPTVQKIPFFTSSQMCDMKDVKQEATPPSESGNNSNSNKQFYQLDKIILTDPDTPAQKKEITTSQNNSSSSGQYATQNHTQMQQQQQQYSVQQSQQQQQQQQYQQPFNSHPFAPQLQQSPLPQKNGAILSANIYQQSQTQLYPIQQQPVKQLLTNQAIQGHQQQIVSSFSVAQEDSSNYQHNTATTAAGQQIYEKSSNFSYDINTTKQEDDSSNYLAQNIYDNQLILQQQRGNPIATTKKKISQKGQTTIPSTSSQQDQQACAQQQLSEDTARQSSQSLSAQQQQQLQYLQKSTKLEDLDGYVNKSKTNKDTLRDVKQAQQALEGVNPADKRVNQSRTDSKQQKQQTTQLGDSSKLENVEESQQKQQQTKQKQEQDQANSVRIKKGQIRTTSVDDNSQVAAGSSTQKEQQIAERNETRYSQLIYQHDLIREESKDSDHSSNTNININQLQDGQFNDNEQQEQQQLKQIGSEQQEIINNLQITNPQQNIHNNNNINGLSNNHNQLEQIQQPEQQANSRYPLPFSTIKGNETNHAEIYQDYHNPVAAVAIAVDGYISGNQAVSESNLAMMGSSLGVEGEKLFTRNGQRQNTGASYMSIESEKMSFKRSDTRNMTGLSNFSIESDKDQRTPQGANRSRFFFNHQNSLEYPPVIGMRSSMRNDTGISNTSENNPNELGGSTMQPQFYSKRSNFKEFSGISHISLEGELGCLQGMTMMNSQTPRQGNFSAMNRSQQRKRANFSVDSLANYNVKAEKDIQNLSFDLDNLNINQQGIRHFGLAQEQVIQNNQNVLDELKAANSNTDNQSSGDAHNNNSNDNTNNNNNNLFFQYAAAASNNNNSSSDQ